MMIHPSDYNAFHLLSVEQNRGYMAQD